MVGALFLVFMLVFSQSSVSAAAGDKCDYKTSSGEVLKGKVSDKGQCVEDGFSLTAPDTVGGGNKPGDNGVNYCGDVNKNAIVTSIDFGCKHKGNAIMDLAFAIIRFLTLGAGMVMIASAIVAGIMYTASRGDPQATAKAMGRIYSTVGALLFFIFTYAILNWLVPNTLLK